LNSSATLISLDIVKRVRPETPDKKVVRIGRISTAVIMVLAILWSTQGDQFGTIFEAINKIPMTFAPAVTTVFVLGVLWKRGTKQGAMTTLYLGSAIGIAYFLIDLPSAGKLFYSPSQLENYTGLISDPDLGLGIPFMLVGPILTVVCIMIYIIRSLATPAMDKELIAEVCWDHPLSFLRGKITGMSDPRVVTLLLIATVAILYLIIQING
jgi:solute:Na+ symporter, SSS family